MLKILKSDAAYDAARQELEQLMSVSNLEKEQLERIELLGLIIWDFEKRFTALEQPDPIDALTFRMRQQGLTARDLIPILGSRSKVSEVLSRSRPLTLSMIRALHEELGIPAAVLIQRSDSEKGGVKELNWATFPVREMVSRGWIKETIEELKGFFAEISNDGILAVRYRKAKHIRSAGKLNEQALLAWLARVANLAASADIGRGFDPAAFDKDVLKRLVRLSVSSDGPLKARDYLREMGVALVIEPNLTGLHLDGAAIQSKKNCPIIALTLRYDRVDSFWFTLMHELGHILLHSSSEAGGFFDDLDLESSDDPFEAEADAFAIETLIPMEEWKRSPASRLRSPEAVLHLAKKLGINPAIVAGKMRHEWKAYRLFTNLVGHRQVRQCFSEVSWKE